MGIRKITFDNGDIVLAKDQAILYDLLLKQQTKTLLPNGKNIYQNSTGFLIQNESEKLKYTYKTTDRGVEFTFNRQLYLSICGRIIKLEKNTKLLVDKNYVTNNEKYYIAVIVDLNKEAKIINGELKEFGNPIEIKIINTVSGLIQDNLNQKSNNGIYEFPLISFKTKFKKDIYVFETIQNIKDESTYLLPILMESSRNPSKLLTINQKIQEEKENIENYLTDLKYIKMKKLRELEKEILGRDIKNWKLIDTSSKEKIRKEIYPINNKWYIMIYGHSNKLIQKTKNDENGKILITYNGLYTGINFGNINYFNIKDIFIYRWDGIGEPKTPTINKENGEIINWNGKSG